MMPQPLLCALVMESLLPAFYMFAIPMGAADGEPAGRPHPSVISATRPFSAAFDDGSPASVPAGCV
jgi:hypothetical protein